MTSVIHLMHRAHTAMFFLRAANGYKWGKNCVFSFRDSFAFPEMNQTFA